jgi:hypothetical protein
MADKELKWDAKLYQENSGEGIAPLIDLRLTI